MKTLKRLIILPANVFLLVSQTVMEIIDCTLFVANVTPFAHATDYCYRTNVKLINWAKR